MASKLTVSKSMKVQEPAEGVRGSQLELKEAVEQPGEEGEKPHLDLSSDEEEVEIEETIEETRAERIKRSSLQRVHTLKTVFSKEKMDKNKQKTKDNLEKTKQKAKDNIEKTKQNAKDNLEKTKQKTKANLEKTKQKTKENLEKTRHNIEKKMGKLGTRMSVNPERKEKMKTSREKMKKSFTPDHTVYACAKTAVYKVPPFTFHVKKVREGAVEVQGTEMVEVSQDGVAYEGVEGEGEGGLEVEVEMMNGGEEEMEDEEEEDEDEDSREMRALLAMKEDSDLVLVEQDQDSD